MNDMINFRSTLVTNSPSANITAKGVDIRFLNIVNRHNAIIWVKFYDSPTASFQDAPVKTFQVAANNVLTLGWISNTNDVIFSTSNGLSVRSTTGTGLDTDNAAPGTLPIIELSYAF